MCRFLLILTYSFLSTFTVFGQNTLTTASRFLSESNLDNRYDLVSDAFKKQVSKEKLAEILSTLDQLHGEIKSYGLVRYSSIGVTDLAYYTCQGAISNKTYKFVINRYTGLINGFFLVSAIPKDDYSYPNHIKEENVRDSIFTFESDGLSFISKMTYADKSKRNSEYTVVLLAGSGPSKIDGGIFNNKTYKELSVGLSQTGYNFVQFNKRSFFNANIQNNATIEQEYFRDAKALINTLNDAGHSKIIVLGHSLGGYLGTQLLTDESIKIDGFISLCAPFGNVLDLIEDQNSRLNSVNGYGQGLGLLQNGESDKTIEQISLIKQHKSNEMEDSVIFGASISYWEELNEFKIMETLATNRIPTLVMHGKHDFQVPTNTHKEWKQEYENCPNYVMKLIPNMNHFLVIQPDGDNPSFYAEKNGISKKCLRQIQKWIKRID